MGILNATFQEKLTVLGAHGARSLGTDWSASSVLTTVLTYTEKTKAGAMRPEGVFCLYFPGVTRGEGQSKPSTGAVEGWEERGGRERRRHRVWTGCWPRPPATSPRPQAPPLSNFICADDLACLHTSMHAINIKSYLLQRGHRFVHLYPYT